MKTGYRFHCFIYAIALLCFSQFAIAKCPASWDNRSLLLALPVTTDWQIALLSAKEKDIVVSDSTLNVSYNGPAGFYSGEIISSDDLKLRSSSDFLCVFERHPSQKAPSDTKTKVSVTYLSNSGVAQLLSVVSRLWDTLSTTQKSQLSLELFDYREPASVAQAELRDYYFVTTLSALFEASLFTQANELVNQFLPNVSPRVKRIADFTLARIALYDKNTESALSYLAPHTIDQHTLSLAEQLELALLVSNAEFTRGNITAGEQALNKVRPLVQKKTSMPPTLLTGYYDNLGHQQLLRYYNQYGANPQQELMEGIGYEYKALTFTAITNDVAKKISVHGNTAWLHKTAGMYSSAIRHYLIALHYSQTYKRPVNLVYLYRNLGTVYLSVGAYSKAANYLNKALELSQDISPYWRAKLHCLLAEASFKSGDSHTAIGLAQQCNTLFEQLIEKSPSTPSYSDGWLDAKITAASILLEQGGTSHQRYHSEIQNKIQEVSSSDTKVRGLAYLIRYFLSIGDHRQAHEYFTLSEAMVQQSSNPILRIESVLVAFDYILSHESLYQAPEIEDILQRVEEIALEFDLTELGPAWSNKINELFAKYTLHLIAQARLEDALSWYSRSRALSLKAHQNRSSLFDSTKQRETLSDISQLSSTLAASNSDSAAKVELDISKDLLKLGQWLPGDDPQLVELQRYKLSQYNSAEKYLKQVNVSAIQQNLHDDEQIMAYFKTDARYFAFVISNNDLFVEQLGQVDDIDSLISELIVALSDPQLPYKPIQQRISQVLLPQGTLKKDTSQLQLVLEGAINQVPFSALLDAQGVPLVHRTRIVHLPALGLARQSNSKSNNLDYAVFAAPLTKANPNQEHWANTLPPLPWAEHEVNEIKTIWPSTNNAVYIGAEATRDNLTQLSVRNAKVLHISTHHFFHPSQPENVGFTLANNNNNGEYDPGFVGVSELTHYRFNNDLVVINGCGSALGQVAEGEGLLSVSRGFLAAGSNHVISTLWPISDRASAEFSKHFYQNLQKQSTYSEALRLAQVNMQANRRFKHPFYWASYSLHSIPNSAH